MYPRGPGGVPCIGSSRFLGRRNSRRYACLANATGSAYTPSRRRRSGSTCSATRDPGVTTWRGGRSVNQSANLSLVDRLDGLAEPRDGPRVLRREVIRILDEREMLKSSQDFRRELAIEEAASGLATGGSTSPLTRGRIPGLCGQQIQIDPMRAPQH